jgi:PTS system fructose-specific IIC component
MKIAIVSACSAGIASTYMAAEALQLAARRRGHEAWAETQGTLGVENQISQTAAASVDGVILAADIKVLMMDRFRGKPILEVGVAEAIRRPDQVLERAERQFSQHTGPVRPDRATPEQGGKQ